MDSPLLSPTYPFETRKSSSYTSISDKLNHCTLCDDLQATLYTLTSDNAHLRHQVLTLSAHISVLDQRLIRRESELACFQELEVQLRGSIDNVNAYNQRYIKTLQENDKEIEHLKNNQTSSEASLMSEIARVRARYEILKDRCSQSRETKDIPRRAAKPISQTKTRGIVSELKDYVAQTKTRIRTQSQNKYRIRYECSGS